MKNRILFSVLVSIVAGGCAAPRQYYDDARALDRMPEAPMKAESDVGDFSAFIDTCLKAWKQNGATCQQFWMEFSADRQRKADARGSSSTRYEADRTVYTYSIPKVRPDLDHMKPYQLTKEDIEEAFDKVERENGLK